MPVDYRNILEFNCIIIRPINAINDNFEVVFQHVIYLGTMP